MKADSWTTETRAPRGRLPPRGTSRLFSLVVTPLSRARLGRSEGRGRTPLPIAIRNAIALGFLRRARAARTGGS